MLVLDRKRLSSIVGCIFIAVFAFMLSGEKKAENSVATVSLPVSGKTIVVDAGHGIPDEGARLLTLIDNN